ncbi:MAG: hypothetical protein E7160_00265 [Firmicutes bacterium]|nr:hypothetical protein [Bacillota bacterium]
MNKDKEYDSKIISQDFKGKNRTYKEFKKDTYKINRKRSIEETRKINEQLKTMKLDSIFSYGPFALLETLGGTLIITGAITNNINPIGFGTLASCMATFGLYALAKSDQENNVKKQINNLKKQRENIIKMYDEMTEETCQEMREHIDNNETPYQLKMKI